MLTPRLSFLSILIHSSISRPVLHSPNKACSKSSRIISDGFYPHHEIIWRIFWVRNNHQGHYTEKWKSHIISPKYGCSLQGHHRTNNDDIPCFYDFQRHSRVSRIMYNHGDFWEYILSLRAAIILGISLNFGSNTSWANMISERSRHLYMVSPGNRRYIHCLFSKCVALNRPNHLHIKEQQREW